MTQRWRDSIGVARSASVNEINGFFKALNSWVMLNAAAFKNLTYLALNWSKTRNSTTKKAFKIPDFSHTLRRASSSVNLESSFGQLTSMQSSAAKVLCLALELAVLHGSPARLLSTLVPGSCQLLCSGLSIVSLAFSFYSEVQMSKESWWFIYWAF